MASLQAIIAGVLVLASALFAVWRLLTPGSRIALLDWLAAAAPGGAGRWLAHRRSNEVARSAGGGCHTCSAGHTRVKRPASARTGTSAAPRR